MVHIDGIKMKLTTVFPSLSNLSPGRRSLVGQGNLVFKKAGSTKFLLHLRIKLHKPGPRCSPSFSLGYFHSQEDLRRGFCKFPEQSSSLDFIHDSRH